MFAGSWEKRKNAHCIKAKHELSHVWMHLNILQEYLSPAVRAPSFSSPGCGGDGSSKIFWIWYSSSLGDSSRPALYTHRRKKRPLWYTTTNSLSCQCWRTSMDEEVWAFTSPSILVNKISLHFGSEVFSGLYEWRKSKTTYIINLKTLQFLKHH